MDHVACGLDSLLSHLAPRKEQVLFLGEDGKALGGNERSGSRAASPYHTRLESSSHVKPSGPGGGHVLTCDQGARWWREDTKIGGQEEGTRGSVRN